EGGFAGSGEAEKERGRAAGANVGRAVHGEYVARRQEIVHHAENGFFHFAGVFGSSNEDDLAREFGGVSGKLGHAGANEKLFDEERVPGIFADDSDRKLVSRVGSGVKVHDVEVALGHVVLDAIEDGLEFLWRKGLVNFAPVDRVSG